MHALLQHRWSPRAFDTRNVEREKLLSILEAARWSPSSNNSQPWRFIVAERQNDIAFHSMLNLLSNNNQRWCKDVPVLMMIVTRTQNADGSNNNYGGHDAGIALANLTLQSLDQGLVVHPMAGFNNERARDTYTIPSDYDPMTIVALGYYGALEQLPEDLQAREIKSRERLPLSELVYEGQFGTVATFAKAN